MTIDDLAGARLSLDLGALVANWRDLNARSAPGRASAVVKANAYGLGVEHVVPALTKAGCDTFFVALPQEGIAVRVLAPDATIYVLNGVVAEQIEALTTNRLRPLLASSDQIRLWTKAGGAPYGVHVDTGMNRLGLGAQEAISMRDTLPVNCTHIMSHFACADDPAHPMNRQQKESFQAVSAVYSDIESSLSNSAATISSGALGFDVTRPGIALYGGAAVNGISNPMRPVVRLDARIVQIRDAKAGETVSYGATCVLTRDSKLAIVSAGYADGYPRSASGSGVPLRDSVSGGAHGFVGGQNVPLVGRVTMDLMCFDVTDVPADGLADGWLELIGPHVSVDDLARAAGTIGYEILTALGARYARETINA